MVCGTIIRLESRRKIETILEVRGTSSVRALYSKVKIADIVEGSKMPDVSITGEAGRLEAKYHRAEKMNSPIALLLHGAPQFGGNMNNPVVYQTYYAMLHRGYTVMRVNFRGVGKSQGCFDHGAGELSDASTALDWLQDSNPGAESAHVVGFSFGAWIAMQLMSRRPEIKGFVCVSPPAGLYDFSMVHTDFCHAKGLIVGGDSDAVARPDDVRGFVDWLNHERHMADFVGIPGANHFFDGKMDELMTTVTSYLDNGIERLAIGN
jgi:uncharacterized protein